MLARTKVEAEILARAEAEARAKAEARTEALALAKTEAWNLAEIRFFLGSQALDEAIHSMKLINNKKDQYASNIEELTELLVLIENASGFYWLCSFLFIRHYGYF